ASHSCVPRQSLGTSGEFANPQSAIRNPQSMEFPQHITRFCFGASYAVALVLELIQLVRPRPLLRWAGLGFGAAGLLAHTLFLLVQRPTVATPHGSLLLLGWVVAVFYFYGA